MTIESPSNLSQKQRVLIRGFAPSEEPRVAELLAASGYNKAETLAGADLVVTGSVACERIVNLARERQISVIPWSEIQEKLAGTAQQGTAQQSAMAEPLRVPLVDHLGGDRVSILGTELPCNGKPQVGLFDGICFDDLFLRALRSAVRGAQIGFPTAFEGPTAASKTSVILWLGRALGRPVTRLNLNGQTDTGELIGRYVPARLGDDWDIQSLTACCEHLQPVTREILQRTSGQLTWGQRAVIRSAEGIESNQWRFQEGVIPQGLRHGHFVLMDEINLADPKILERLNSVLESQPSLLLSEGDHTRWGAGGLPVHPNFRLFATLNPAEYAGRSVMSPSFRDRWINYFHAESPGEREYLAHLRLIVFGEQPIVRLDGRTYQAPASAPTLPRLANVPGIEGLLERLARFHAMLSRASTLDEVNGQPSLGRSRRERYVFSRRGLIACLQLWNAVVQDHPSNCPTQQLGQAISALYLDRMAAANDRKAARSIAAATGLPLEANS